MSEPVWMIFFRWIQNSVKQRIQKRVNFRTGLLLMALIMGGHNLFVETVTKVIFWDSCIRSYPVTLPGVALALFMLPWSVTSLEHKLFEVRGQFYFVVAVVTPTAWHSVRYVLIVLGFPGSQPIKNPPAMQKTWLQSLSQEDPLEKEMATHSSILAWRNPVDRGAWWATVCGFAKNRPLLSD